MAISVCLALLFVPRAAAAEVPHVAQPFGAALAAAAQSPTTVAPETAGAAQTRTRRDPWWDGALLGAGIGMGLGLVGDYYDDCEECHDALYGSIVYGAGIGALVDFLWRDNPRTPKTGEGQTSERSRDRADSMRPAVSVAAGPHRFAVQARVRWP
ncbi:MAG TPA: hypothetical protein VMF13_04145 [Luteitalea sp.]|nr:hypothetical protein [Luteitalea sp.]